MKKRIPRQFDYYVLLFFAAAFVGWLWEVFLYLIITHTFVNRGVCRGPYLPIYGIGGILLMQLLQKFRKRPFCTFFLSCTLCTVLEYFAGVWLEWKWDVRWWDYSEYPWNIDGHICLASSIGFGLGGVLMICILQPVFNKLYHHMTLRMRVLLCVLLILIFIADAAYSAALPNMGDYISVFGF